ncbi:MAG: DUF342 domain-containing protein, partial [Treponema sp.]|nr:DUF342 domain-containing protein [Treponema sp.]
MVNLEKLRGDLEKKLSVDKQIHSVVVRADTIDDCLEDAAVQLETSVKRLEYEVEERGSQGFLGLAQKPWVLRIYEDPTFVQEKMQKEQAAAAAARAEEEKKALNQDGIYYVHRFGDRIFVKIVLPVGDGQPVSLGDVLSAAKRSDTEELDENLIKKLCKEGSAGEYVEVGVFAHVLSADAVMAVDVAKDEMSATIEVSAPGASGSEISADQIRNALRTQGVVAGISEEKISEYIDNPVYNVPFVVAEAVKAVDGADARMEYKFETDSSKLKLKENQD